MADPVAVENAAIARRMGWCRDILGVRGKLATVPADRAINARVLAKARVGALRRLLIGQAPSLADELLSPATGFKKLAEILRSANGVAEAEKHATEAYVDEIFKMLKSISNAGEQAGIGAAEGEKECRDAYSDFGGVKINEAVNSLVDANIERGKFGEAFRDEIAHAASMKEPSALRIEDVAPELAEKYAEAQRRIEPFAKELREANEAYWRANDWERPAAQERKNKADAEYKAVADSAYGIHINEIVPALKRAQEELEAPVRAVGQKAISAVMDASPVSEDAARAWADSVEISTAAANRLKKDGYELNRVRADMAEFYRFVGGRVGTLGIDTDGKRRAKASTIFSGGERGTVWLGRRFNKRVLWHELAHHIEADPVARSAAGRFIRRRSVNGDAVVPLRRLTGHDGYKKEEVAYQDGFFDPYVGKAYSNGVTEVFSMGIESFSDPLMLGRRMIQDPQTLEFVSGYLKAEQSPLYRAYMHLREAMLELNDDAKGEKDNSVEELRATLAQGVVIDPVSAFPDGTPAQWTNGGKIIGRMGDSGWFVLAEKVRNPETKRKGNGLALYRFNREDRGWTRDTRYYATTDQIFVKAAFAVYQKIGVMPNFSELNNHETLRKHAEP